MCLRSHQNHTESEPMCLQFYLLQHASLRIAYTATAINQVVYCRFLWRFSWLVTLISLRRKKNEICSNSPKLLHILIFKKNKRKLNPKVKNRTSLATFWTGTVTQTVTSTRSRCVIFAFGLKIYILFHRILQYGRRGINSSISAKSIYYVTHCQPLSGDNWDVRGAGRRAHYY